MLEEVEELSNLGGQWWCDVGSLHVEVVRRRDVGDVRRIKSAMLTRDPYVSMLFFAEGTRARDGSFREFKMGAFATAVEEQLPILPIAVAGSYAICAAAAMLQGC